MCSCEFILIHLLSPCSPDQRVGHLQRHLSAVGLAQQQLVHVHAQVLRRRRAGWAEQATGEASGWALLAQQPRHLRCVIKSSPHHTTLISPNHHPFTKPRGTRGARPGAPHLMPTSRSDQSSRSPVCKHGPHPASPCAKQHTPSPVHTQTHNQPALAPSCASRSQAQPLTFANTGSKACSASISATEPPAFCTSAMACSASVVLPLLSAARRRRSISSRGEQSEQSAACSDGTADAQQASVHCTANGRCYYALHGQRRTRRTTLPPTGDGGHPHHYGAYTTAPPQQNTRDAAVAPGP